MLLSYRAIDALQRTIQERLEILKTRATSGQPVDLTHEVGAILNIQLQMLEIIRAIQEEVNRTFGG